ncbi:synaptic vesicle glycoprotein 2C-like [Frankliniella occidentalis]|uniref:Synaptic vesicle glycoprotein 2C-like n=1 Tax=Frankliniella occidentalis TaxID=133901 RepID=A0A9C6X015_FRAOC|nr:synaptic vesicle glycoprotein 2C-like [Frankliniella occidentalis]
MVTCEEHLLRREQLLRREHLLRRELDMERLALLSESWEEEGRSCWFGTLSIEKKDRDAPANYETAIIACGFGKFHYLLMAALIPFCCSQLFSSGSTAFVLPVAGCDLELEDYQKGTLNGATYLGNIVSGLLWGGMADMFGRKMILAMCFLVDFIVSLACAFANSYWQMLVLKILAGVVIAGPNSVLYAYLAETHDDKHRSMAIMMTGMCFAVAQIVQPVLAFALLPLDLRVPMIEGAMDLTSWRLFLLVCALPSLWAGLWCLRLPESPKFLMSQGKQEEALRIFRGIYATNTGQDPDTYPIKSLDICVPSKHVQLDGSEEGGLRRAWRQFSPLFHKPYLSRIATVVCIQVSLMICINSLRLWTPQLFAYMEQYETGVWEDKPAASTACQMISASIDHQGSQSDLEAAAASAAGLNATAACVDIPVSADVYLRSVVIGVVGTSSFLVSGWASKLWGNRPLLLWSFPLALVAALGLLWAPDSDIFTVLLSAFTPFTAIGLTALSATGVDLFPTSLRSVAVSMQLISGRMGSLCGNIILPLVLKLSCEAVFILVTVGLAICSVLVWFLPKKPKEVK